MQGLIAEECCTEHYWQYCLWTGDRWWTTRQKDEQIVEHDRLSYAFLLSRQGLTSFVDTPHHKLYGG